MTRSISSPENPGRLKLLFALVPLAVLLVVGEFCARVLVGGTFEPFMIARSDYLPFTTPRNTDFRLRNDGPGAYDVVLRFDHEGFRVASRPSEPWRSRRSLYLGDSFVMGWGVSFEDSFVGRLQRRMPAHRTILAAGYTAGPSPDGYYAYLVRNRERLGIDEVKVFLHDNNDISDVANNVWLERDAHGGPTALRTLRRYVDYRGEPLDYSRWSGLPFVPGLRHSALYRKGLVAVLPRVTPGTFDASAEALDPATALRNLIVALDAMIGYCRRTDLPLSYVLIPPAVEQRTEDWRNANTVLKSFLAYRARIPVLDLEPVLIEEHYIPEDFHLNATGSAAAADAIWEHIRTDAPLPP